MERDSLRRNIQEENGITKRRRNLDIIYVTTKIVDQNHIGWVRAYIEMLSLLRKFGLQHISILKYNAKSYCTDFVSKVERVAKKGLFFKNINTQQQLRRVHLASNYSLG